MTEVFDMLFLMYKIAYKRSSFRIQGNFAGFFVVYVNVNFVILIFDV